MVHHHNRHNRLKVYDFSELPVAEPMQRSLAALFAACCAPHKWAAHSSSTTYWGQVRAFARFLSQLEQPPGDLDELTGSVLERWRMNLPRTNGGFASYANVARLLRDDPRLQSGPVAEVLARRFPCFKSGVQSYSVAEFDLIKTAARRQFRAALLRIEENARHLDNWRQGLVAEGCRDWVIGEALDILARTGDLPKYGGKPGARGLVKRFRRALGGTRAEVTWQRLFLSRLETAALGVLLLAEYGWNLSVIDHAEVPRALPDPGLDGHPTYRIPLEKHRRGGRDVYETRNVTDDGAASRGRLITQALDATRFARAIVEDLAPGTDLLLVWRTGHVGGTFSDHDRHPPVGLFRFGCDNDAAREWAKKQGFTGSPFRRGRRTVLAVDRREPAQHSQATHDRRYALVDRRVQAEAVEVIAEGAQDAADRARQVVLRAQVRDRPDPADQQTATADCSDFDNSPRLPAPGGGCGASFLDCLDCENARVHPGHHPRLVHLHHALGNLRTAVPPPVWDADWSDPHARLDHLKREIGDGPWNHAATRITDTDRDIVDLLLTGNLNT